MPKFLFLFLVANLLNAGRGNAQSAVKDSLTTKLPSRNQTDELIQKFKPIIQGVWLKADYVNKVGKTKSPLAASDQAMDITTMYINSDSVKGDSIIVPVGAGNHDGSNLRLKFIPGKNKSTIVFGAGELSYLIEHGDTILMFSNFDEQKKHFVKTRFIRAYKREPNDELAYGMYYYINKILVAGNYSLIDSVGTAFKVNLSQDGKVSGFFNFKSYIINIDLNSDVNDNLDEISFETLSNANTNFSFKINKDTLELYDMYENVDSTKLVLGKLKYILIRQK